eukprot:TRINITY_DN13873_c0_g1_i1.p1 TRINITY_DN13873_c0_g1~~TRINITY_DN13873_c0_g1_i1.p1  ORF type:complete len:679 (+),score=159.60 TRINITY_DN13873_c0_g1_i1:50-2038(+)
MAGELVAERKSASFDIRELTYLLGGGKERVERREYLQDIVAKDPVFRKEDHLDRVGYFKRSLEKSKRFYQLKTEMNLNMDDIRFVKSAIDQELPTDLHDGMFVYTILGQGTDEQKEYWLPKAACMEIIGCYAQTELGHGSNVRGLETTATYDADTEEFVFQSPSLTSAKWWPGGLGKTATHAMVFARLLLKGKDHGVHPFIVQIRDMETHRPLPGVQVGDIGHKFGYNGNDNGYLLLRNVRCPRHNMMMKFSRVTADGKYEKPPHDKLSYGTMITIRAFIVFDASANLQRAVTIAVRYGAVRRQFSQEAGSKTEMKVLDYRMQQYRLFPLLATAYAFHFTGEFMLKLYRDLQKDLSTGNFDILAEVHATSSGLKAITTWTTADGIETCRKCCGGHGYLNSSGLPELFTRYVPACTYEGDNVVLLQQTARFLLKALADARASKPLSPSVQYLSNIASIKGERCTVKRVEDWFDSEVQLAAFRHRSARLAAVSGRRVQSEIMSGKSPMEAFNVSMIELVRMSKAHVGYVIANSFIDAICDIKRADLRTVMKRLCDLYALYTISNELADFLEDEYMTGSQTKMLRQAIEQCLIAIRPDAVPLVDAFALSDFVLNSTLGRHDGDVYNALWEHARAEPLNKNEVVDGYVEHIRPMLKQQVVVASARL